MEEAIFGLNGGRLVYEFLKYFPAMSSGLSQGDFIALFKSFGILILDNIFGDVIDLFKDYAYFLALPIVAILFFSKDPIFGN